MLTTQYYTPDVSEPDVQTLISYTENTYTAENLLESVKVYDEMGTCISESWTTYDGRNRVSQQKKIDPGQILPDIVTDFRPGGSGRAVYLDDVKLEIKDNVWVVPEEHKVKENKPSDSRW